MSVKLIFENALNEPVVLILDNKDDFSEQVKAQMQLGTPVGPGLKPRLIKHLGPKRNFTLDYVSASGQNKTGTHGLGG